MQKHLILLRLGPSQLKGRKTLLRKSDAKTEPISLAGAHLQMDVSTDQSPGSAIPCHELEEQPDRRTHGPW